ncbi:universal stress protein UspE [compost metagenome]
MIMGSPGKILIRFAEAYDTDVIVMGRVGHRGLGRLIGSTVEHLLYKMPCSVWVVYTERLDE